MSMKLFVPLAVAAIGAACVIVWLQAGELYVPQDTIGSEPSHVLTNIVGGPPQIHLIPDDGNIFTPATYTTGSLEGATVHVLDCLDPQGCDVTLSDGANDGDAVLVVQAGFAEQFRSPLQIFLFGLPDPVTQESHAWNVWYSGDWIH